MKTREFKIEGTITIGYDSENEIKNLQKAFAFIKNALPLYPQVDWDKNDFKVWFKNGITVNGEA